MPPNSDPPAAFAFGEEVVATCAVTTDRKTVVNGATVPVELLPGTVFAVVASVPTRDGRTRNYLLREKTCRIFVTLPEKFLRPYRG